MLIDIESIEKEFNNDKNIEYLLELLRKQKESYEEELLRKDEILKLEKYLNAKTDKKDKEIKKESIKKDITKRKTIDITLYKAKEFKTKEALIEILKDLDIEEYDEVINLLILHYIKEKTELMNIIASEYQTDILEEFKEEINNLDLKINLLLELKNKKEETKKEQNKIMCLTKLSGENIIIDDIENILSKNPTESTLKTFKELLESIIDGTFKGMKRFTNNQKLNTLSEVKQENARIVFKRLDKNTYLIIYMFIKDCRKDKLYQDTLKTRQELFLAQKDELKEQITEDTDKILKYFKGVKQC